MENPGPCTVNSNILYIIFLKIIIISNEIHLWSGRIHMYKSLCISADRDALYEETWPTGIMPGLARFCECMISSSGAWRPFRFRFLSTFFPSFFFCFFWLLSEMNRHVSRPKRAYRRAVCPWTCFIKYLTFANITEEFQHPYLSLPHSAVSENISYSQGCQGRRSNAKSG